MPPVSASMCWQRYGNKKSDSQYASDNSSNVNSLCYITKSNLFKMLLQRVSGNNSFTKKHKTTLSLGQRKAVQDFLYTVFLTENLLIRSMNCEF